MRLLTVATANYLHQVDVMFSYARRIHPELRLTVLVADCSPSALDPVRDAFGSAVDVLSCADLECDFLNDMRTYYTALEFCSALKVLGSAYILRTEESCLFLDPDMIILDSLFDTVINSPCEIAVCCHTFAPYPLDGASPDDLELCRAGQLNGGVLLSKRGQVGNVALDWLIEKTRSSWFVAPELGMYADQQWLSELPYFFRDQTKVISDRGVNVAYWNLHERPLRRVTPAGRVTLSDGGPLRLMHFSGFSMPSGGRLSKHSNRRFDVKTEEILVEMVSAYEAALTDSRARLGHLTGDLGFSKLTLTKRMQLAAKRWGTQDSAPPNKLNLGFRQALKKMFGNLD